MCFLLPYSFLFCSCPLVTIIPTFIQDLFLHSCHDHLCDHRFANIYWSSLVGNCWVYSWRQWPLPQNLSVSKNLAEKEEWGAMNLSLIHDWLLTNPVSWRQMQTTLAAMTSCLYCLCHVLNITFYSPSFWLLHSLCSLLQYSLSLKGDGIIFLFRACTFNSHIRRTLNIYNCLHFLKFTVQMCDGGAGRCI